MRAARWARRAAPCGPGSWPCAGSGGSRCGCGSWRRRCCSACSSCRSSARCSTPRSPRASNAAASRARSRRRWPAPPRPRPTGTGPPRSPSTSSTSPRATSWAASSARPGPTPTRYVVMSRSLENQSDVVLASVTSGALDLSVVSTDLQQAVSAQPTRLQTQLTEVTVGGQDMPARRRRQRRAGADRRRPHDLYFLFPMEQEVATMDLIGRAFLIAGVILSLLVGAARVARHPTGRHPGPPGGARWRSGCPPAGSTSGCRLAARTTSPSSRRPSTTWPTASSRQIRQLEGLSAVQQRFVSDVSHELRTPLTTIRMAGRRHPLQP